MPSDPPPAWLLQQRVVIGRRIRLLRERAGLSQEMLAELAGLDRKTVYRTELGTHAASLDVLLRIAHSLDVPLAELVGE